MNQQVTVIDQFKVQLRTERVQENLSAVGMKGKGMLEKFTAITIHAVTDNPKLLACDRTSLFLACQSAAKDGLMPDGREGALIPYGKQVQWQPMIGGIRKKLAQAGWDIRAEIVHKNDEFRQEMGDNPEIVHRPEVFDDRGPIIGAYAIATNIETGDKYRETMKVEEMDKVRKNTDAWKLWTTEMYRKTVAKRLRKYLPISDDSLLDLIDRDNDQFEAAPTGLSKTAQAVQEAVKKGSAPIDGELLEPEKAKPKKKKVTKKKVTKKPEPEPVAAQTQEPEAPPDMGPEPPLLDEEGDPLGF